MFKSALSLVFCVILFGACSFNSKTQKEIPQDTFAVNDFKKGIVAPKEYEGKEVDIRELLLPTKDGK